ncbi:hypothetical protein BJX99DRAFT_265600 [Aspergillus californicus]
MTEILDDQMIRSGLYTIQGKIRRWACKYAIPNDLCENLKPEEKDHIISQLKGYCVQIDWDSLQASLPMRLQLHMGRLLTEALVAKYVFSTMFDNPFFAFPQEEHPTLPNQQTMAKLYGTLESIDMNEAQRWRSSLLELLFQHPESSFGSTLPSKLSLFSSDLLNMAQVLLKPLEDERKCAIELEELIHSAGSLAMCLWNQMPSMLCLDLDVLEAFMGTEAVKAHFLHGIQGVPNPQTVLIMTQPTVAAFVDEGFDYKLWASASVCIRGDL